MGRLVSSSESKASNTSYKNEYTVQYDGLGYVIEEENIIDYLASSTSYDLSLRTVYYHNYNGTLAQERTHYSDGGEVIISEYTYDDFNRLTKNYSWSDDFRHTTNYTYYSSGTATANLISTFTSTVNGTSITYNYTYDSKGNITRISDGNGNYVDYTYDDLGQLISETDGTVTWTYTYDNAGNITSITDTTVSETTDPDPGFTPIIRVVPLPTITTNTITLEYTNSEWGDLLTSYNGTAITYDGIGNPLSYYNGSSYTFTWEGRRLVGAVKGSSTMSFEYNDEGIRTSKTVNGVETVYYVNGSQIIAEKTGTRTIAYIYDASGTPIGMMYRTTSYAEGAFDVFWYEKNLQGDVIAVYNSAGTKVATYTYTDAWGNHTVSYSNGGASTGVVYNPFRYRSYYYDKDLGMYYLQSRYYDANICRFINADSALYHSMLGYNMFAYCENNPVNYIDTTGESAEAVSEAAKYFWWLIFVDGALPIGDVIFFVVMGTVIIIEVSEIIRLAAENVSNNDADDVPNSLTDPDAEEIGDDAASLPQQGNVTSGVPGAPSVEAGKQGKHVPGHNNYKANKTKWPNGKNGVRETQEAWKNSVPDPKKPNTRIGISNNGTKVEIKIAKKGIHGYPIFP